MKIFSEELVEQAVRELHIADLSRATIGEVLLVAQYLENKTGVPFIRMDQGSPGLPVNKYGVEAEKAALDRGVGSQYPAAAGVPELKTEASRFVKAFLDVEMSSTGQMIDDVRLSVEGRKPIRFLGHAGGVIPSVEEIAAAAENALKEVR